MSLNSFPNGTNLGYCIVVGGHKGDAAPDESGTMKVIDPTRHASSISHKELPFITMLRSPTMASQEETAFPPDPGTCVAVSWTTGDPTSRTVMGMPNETNNSGPVAGNNPLMAHILKSMAYETGKLISKGSKTKVDGGAIIKEVINGNQWKHALTQGLATHAAWYPMAGQIINQIKQIDTAIKQFVNIPSLDALSSLPGQFMNLGSILSSMTQKQFSKATQNMDSNMVAGLSNMVELLSETDTGGMFLSDGRVDTQTLIENAVELFSQATTMADVIEIMQRLRSDTSLHGHDKLGTVVIKVEGVFGNVYHTIDVTGNVLANAANTADTQNAISSLVSTMGGSQGGGGNKSLFGDAARLVSEAIGRIPPNLRKKLLTDTPEGTKKTKHDEIHKRLTKGINPIDLFT